MVMMSPKSIAITFSSLIVFSCSWLYFSHTLIPSVGDHKSDILPSRISRDFHAPKVNAWAELSKVEFDDLLNFLYNRSQGLGLSEGVDTTG